MCGKTIKLTIINSIDTLCTYNGKHFNSIEESLKSDLKKGDSNKIKTKQHFDMKCHNQIKKTK